MPCRPGGSRPTSTDMSTPVGGLLEGRLANDGSLDTDDVGTRHVGCARHARSDGERDRGNSNDSHDASLFVFLHVQRLGERAVSTPPAARQLAAGSLRGEGDYEPQERISHEAETAWEDRSRQSPGDDGPKPLVLYRNETPGRVTTHLRARPKGGRDERKRRPPQPVCGAAPEPESGRVRSVGRGTHHPGEVTLRFAGVIPATRLATSRAGIRTSGIGMSRPTFDTHPWTGTRGEKGRKTRATTVRLRRQPRDGRVGPIRPTDRGTSHPGRQYSLSQVKLREPTPRVQEFKPTTTQSRLARGRNGWTRTKRTGRSPHSRRSSRR